jgi:hypothetical protein
VTVKRDATPPTAPVIGGIGAQTFERAFLPPQSAIGCTASDATSGLDPSGCVVSGYSNALGSHMLTATARDNAGLTSATSLAYRVVRTKPPISRLRAARVVSTRGFLRGGLGARVRVTRPRTRLVASLRGPGGVLIARSTRASAGAATATLRLRPSRRGRALVRKRRRTALTLAVSATPRVGAPLTLHRRLLVGR